MKRIAVLALVILLLMVNVNPSASTEKDKEKEKLKVLIDESRVHAVDEKTREAYVADIEKLLKEMEALLRALGINVTLKVACDEKYSFNNLGEPWGFGLAKVEIEEFSTVTIRESGTLTYPTLMKYDVLVIASFDKTYSPAEVEAIKKFVENGGGLLLYADIDSQNNSVSQAFGVSFFEERAVIADDEADKIADDNHGFYIDDIVSHPITKDVKKIALNNGIPITSHKSGNVLVSTGESSWIDQEGNGSGKKGEGEREGPFDILLAVEDSGKGRAVFFGGAVSFWNEVIYEFKDNLNLFADAVEWLGKPGGPYKQYKIMNEQAQALLQKGISLYGKNEFSEAEKAFLDVIGIFEESNETYPNSEAIGALEEARKYIEKCKTGQEADETFERAEDFFGNKEYEKAVEEYSKAVPLYLEIEYTGRVEACRTRIDESNRLIGLRVEATSLFSQAEEALGQTSGMFDVTRFETARSLFEQSLKKWEEYDDPAQVEACEEKISFCNSEIERMKNTKTMIIVVAGVVVAVCVIAAVVFVGRRKRAQKQ